MYDESKHFSPNPTKDCRNKIDIRHTCLRGRGLIQDKICNSQHLLNNQPRFFFLFFLLSITTFYVVGLIAFCLSLFTGLAPVSLVRFPKERKKKEKLLLMIHWGVLAVILQTSYDSVENQRIRPVQGNSHLLYVSFASLSRS